MPKKNKIKWDARWAEAKRKCRLNAETVRMAKELGMNPRKLVKNIPSKAQSWKAPVQVWVRDMYAKSQAKAARKRAKREMTQANNENAGAADGSATVEMKQPHPVDPRDLDEIPF